MGLQVFDFPYHTIQDIYPESSSRLQLGKGYQFASKPIGPDQVTFNLSFNAMIWFCGSDGRPEAFTEPQKNMERLMQFYEAHRLYEKFWYDHPRRGLVQVRFAKPLQQPKSIQGGTFRHGVTEPFNIEFLLQP